MKLHRWIATLGIATAVIAGCDDDPTPTPPEDEPAATASASARAAKSASTKKAAPTPAAADGALAALPVGGMIYGRGNLTLVDVLLGMMPPEEKERTAAMMEEVLGAKVTDAASLSKALGLDPKRPVLMGIVGPPLAGVEKLVDTFMGFTTEEERRAEKNQLEALLPLPASFARFVFPLDKDDAKKLLSGAEKMVEAKAELCAESKKCKAFKNNPHSLFIGREVAVAAYVADKTLTLDMIMAPFNDLGSDEVLSALAAFHDDKGGPKNGAGGTARCRQVASAKGTSLCILPDLAADAGVATGLQMTLGAVSAKSIDLKQAIAIAKVGKKESLQSREILNLEPKVLGDGTFTLSGTAKAVEMKASWLADDKGQKLLADFSKEQCASGGKEAITLLEKLRDAFAIKNKADPALWEQVKEAGWGAYPVMAGGAWPTYIPFMLEGAKEAPEAFEGKVCIRLKDQRLHIESSVALHKMLMR